MENSPSPTFSFSKRKKSKSPAGIKLETNTEELKLNVIQIKEIFLGNHIKSGVKEKVISDIDSLFMQIYDNIFSNINYKEKKCEQCIACDKFNSDKDNILKDSSMKVSYTLVLDENNVLESLIKNKMVCKINDDVVKKSLFNSGENVTIFLLIWEIAIQNYLNMLCKTDPNLIKLSVPLIKEHYLTDNNEFSEIIMLMDYIETIPLKKENLKQTISLLDYLISEYNIFHNDTHSENIRQTSDGQIVFLDWGKGNLSSASPSQSGLYPEITDFYKWLEHSDLKGYPTDKVGPFFYGGKKSKKKTNKKTNKKSNKKSKKKTNKKTNKKSKKSKNV